MALPPCPIGHTKQTPHEKPAAPAGTTGFLAFIFAKLLFLLMSLRGHAGFDARYLVQFRQEPCHGGLKLFAGHGTEIIAHAQL